MQQNPQGWQNVHVVFKQFGLNALGMIEQPQLFFNGQKVASTEWTLPADDVAWKDHPNRMHVLYNENEFVSPSFGKGNRWISLGHTPSMYGNLHIFQGKMANVRIYNKALYLGANQGEYALGELPADDGSLLFFTDREADQRWIMYAQGGGCG